MADLHPTELGCAFQGGIAPEGRPAEPHLTAFCSADTRPPEPHRTKPHPSDSCSADSYSADSYSADSCSVAPRPTELRTEHRRSSPAFSKAVLQLLQPKQLRTHVRRLHQVVRYFRRVEAFVNASMEDQSVRREEKQPQRAASPVLPALPQFAQLQQLSQFAQFPPLPPEGGEYRLFYVSPLGLRMEQEFLQRYNAHGLKDLLHLSSSILHSYSGLIHNSGVGPSEIDGVLASMADVLQVALNAVNSAEQLCTVLEPVDLRTL